MICKRGASTVANTAAVPKMRDVDDAVFLLDHIVVGGGVDDGVFFTALTKELDEFM